MNAKSIEDQVQEFELVKTELLRLGQIAEALLYSLTFNPAVMAVLSGAERIELLAHDKRCTACAALYEQTKKDLNQAILDATGKPGTHDLFSRDNVLSDAALALNQRLSEGIREHANAANKKFEQRNHHLMGAVATLTYTINANNKPRALPSRSLQREALQPKTFRPRTLPID
jgi:hypothetical protein